MKLGDLVKPAKVERAGSTEYPLLSMTMRNGLVPQGEKFKKRVAGADLSQYKVVQNGQLVVGFPIDEAVLAFQRTLPAGIVSPAYAIWDIKDSSVTDALYLERFLRSPVAIAYYLAKLQGSTARRRSLPNRVFLDMEVPHPRIQEQRRIAAILDEADELRTKRRQAIAHFDTLTESIFHELEAQALTMSRLKLAEACSKIQTGPFGSLLHKEDYVVDGIPLINPMHIRDGRIVVDSSFSITTNKFSELSGYHLFPGDVVLGRRGEIGRCAEVLDTHGPLLCGTGSLIVRPSPHHLLPTYLSAVLSSQSTRRRLGDVAQGATMLNLNTKIVGSLEIPVPPLELQQTFAARVAAVERLKETQRKHLIELDTLFASLQHRAFRGEL
ncbi:type I restriction enzyme S subunit [Arthrobacter sp. 1088]|uniref:restriction endonuclease subunit S n=1 Tax=Arthrobacter sp. 1088 TaxID=2817768 RepID=UPI00285B9B78|nr:restriction endonuclease subunit S [Arthrobacter sp. 1088]MDR6686219.1 type I restriction enzyme S subunit [Arthrobacter sp. 1088]